MLNMSDIIRGYTDTIILAQLVDKDSYGYEINKSVLKITDGSFEIKEATLYTSFRRLEQDGQIISYWGDQTTGARRRYYSITDSGTKLFTENKKDWEKVKKLINTLLNKTEVRDDKQEN